MSQVMSTKTKLAGSFQRFTKLIKFVRSSEGTSSQPIRVVRDSHLDLRGNCTSYECGVSFARQTTGTFTRFIKAPTTVSALVIALLGLSFITNHQDTYATEAMTLSISGDTLALNLAPNDSAGTFGKSDLNISVAMAVTGGYNLTITGNNSTGNLTGADDSSHIISSISGTVSESDFSNSANTSYNNKWGYKVAKNSATNNNYVAAPTTATTTLDTVSSFSGTNNYTLTLGARANISTPIDSYRATFVIAAVSTITCNSSATTISTAICMQDINDNVINSMVTDTQYRLMDNRDNKLYYIAKMQDGRVWMLDNLRLDLTNSTVINNLSSTNTNATDTQLNYLKNSGGATNDQYAVGGLSGSNVTSGFNQYYTPQVNNTYKNNIAPDVDGLGSGKIGVYYNYCATSASSYCYNSNGGVDKQDTYRDIEGDICPAGWRLPSGNSRNNGYSIRCVLGSP